MEKQSSYDIGFQVGMLKAGGGAMTPEQMDVVADYLSDDPVLRTLKHMGIGALGGGLAGGLGGAGLGFAGPEPETHVPGLGLMGGLGGAGLGAAGGLISSLISGRMKRREALADYITRARRMGA